MSARTFLPYVFAVVLLGAATTLVVRSLSDEPRSDEQAVTTQADGTTSASLLRVLRRDLTPTDAPDAEVTRLLKQTSVDRGTDPSLLDTPRRALADDSVSVWVIPVSGSLAACLLVTDGEATGFGCHNADAVRDGRATTTTVGIGGRTSCGLRVSFPTMSRRRKSLCKTAKQ